MGKFRLILANILLISLFLTLLIYFEINKDKIHWKDYIYTASMSLKIIYIYIIFTTLIFVRKTSLYFIFLICYFIFILGAVFFKNETEILEFNSIAGVKIFSEKIIFDTLIFNIFTILLVHLGFSISLLYKKNNKQELSFSPRLFYNARVLFLVSMPFCLIKFIYEIKTISSIGYVGYYKYGVEMPLIISLMRFIFEVSFLLILAAKPNYKQFKIYTFLFILVMSFFLLIGVRSKFILYVIFIFWYYYKVYQPKDISYLKLSLYFFIAISLLILTQLYRQNWVFNSDLDYATYFFKSQSLSFYLLPLTIEYIDSFKALLPSIFSPFSIESFLYTSQSIDRLENVNLLGDIISYSFLKNLYFDGHGIGGSFIAELYQAGILITFILSFLLGFIINIFDRIVLHYRILLAISFYVVSNISYMPRSSFFRTPYMPLFMLVFFIFFYNIPRIRFYIRNIKK